MLKKVFKIGIRKEEYNKWERRVPLPPKYCRKLLQQLDGQLEIKVESCGYRVFADEKFKKAGCTITNDISDCDLIVGVKPVPSPKLYKNKTYMFFSHTIKAQPENMEMLDDILAKNIRLIDYEKIVNGKGRRLVAFGVFAGYAGSIDTFSGLGSFLLNRKLATPFINLSQSFHFFNIDHAMNNLRFIGNQIENSGFPLELVPFVVGITGTGRVGQGIKEIVEKFPYEYVDPDGLEDFFQKVKKDPQSYRYQVYLVQFHHQHLVEKKNKQSFDKQDYYENPQNYRPIF